MTDTRNHWNSPTRLSFKGRKLRGAFLTENSNGWKTFSRVSAPICIHFVQCKRFFLFFRGFIPLSQKINDFCVGPRSSYIIYRSGASSCKWKAFSTESTGQAGGDHPPFILLPLLSHIETLRQRLILKEKLMKAFNHFLVVGRKNTSSW